MERRTIWSMIGWRTSDLDRRWDCIQKGIKKKKAILEGSGDRFTPEEYMEIYTTIFNLCNTQEIPLRNDNCQPLHELYEMYKKALEEYINAMVLPCIREKHDECCMLMALVAGWNKHKLMVRWLSCLFHYLDKYFIPRMSLPPLGEVGLTCFRDLVYEEAKGKATAAVNILIDKEREGEQINRELLKDVLNIYVQMGMGVMDRYEEDLEKHVLEDTGAYYSRKASNWSLEDSCSDYMLKCEECLKKERDRASNFLHSSTWPKLIERVQHELLVVFSSQLLQKEHSGCRALLRDDKVDDLSRMYRLFHEIPQGLDSVTGIFKQDVTAEGMVLVQQAEDVASSQAGSGVQEQLNIEAIQTRIKELINLEYLESAECYLLSQAGNGVQEQPDSKAIKRRIEELITAEYQRLAECDLLSQAGSGVQEQPDIKAIKVRIEEVITVEYLHHAECYLLSQARSGAQEQLDMEAIETMLIGKLINEEYLERLFFHLP